MDFYVERNGEYHKLAEISDCDLQVIEQGKDCDYVHEFTSESMSFVGVVEDKRGRNVVRMICSGGDRGLYNGLTLKEEGYLSPKNAWL